MKTQLTSYGCGLYAVANAFDLPDFISEERLELSKNGIHNGTLNKYLEEDGLGVFIDVLYCDTCKNALPDDWTGLHIEGDNILMPLLIQCIIGKKFHLMGAKLYQDRSIILYDSLKKEPLKCTLKDVNLMYEKVVALYAFNVFETGEYVYFKNN